MVTCVGYHDESTVISAEGTNMEMGIYYTVNGKQFSEGTHGVELGYWRVNKQQNSYTLPEGTTTYSIEFIGGADKHTGAHYRKVPLWDQYGNVSDDHTMKQPAI